MTSWEEGKKPLFKYLFFCPAFSRGTLLPRGSKGLGRETLQDSSNDGDSEDSRESSDGHLNLRISHEVDKKKISDSSGRSSPPHECLLGNEQQQQPGFSVSPNGGGVPLSLAAANTAAKRKMFRKSRKKASSPFSRHEEKEEEEGDDARGGDDSGGVRGSPSRGRLEERDVTRVSDEEEGKLATEVKEENLGTQKEGRLKKKKKTAVARENSRLRDTFRGSGGLRRSRTDSDSVPFRGLPGLEARSAAAAEKSEKRRPLLFKNNSQTPSFLPSKTATTRTTSRSTTRPRGATSKPQDAPPSVHNLSRPEKEAERRRREESFLRDSHSARNPLSFIPPDQVEKSETAWQPRFEGIQRVQQPVLRQSRSHESPVDLLLASLDDDKLGTLGRRPTSADRKGLSPEQVKELLRDDIRKAINSVVAISACGSYTSGVAVVRNKVVRRLRGGSKGDISQLSHLQLLEDEEAERQLKEGEKRTSGSRKDLRSLKFAGNPQVSYVGRGRIKNANLKSASPEKDVSYDFGSQAQVLEEKEEEEEEDEELLEDPLQAFMSSSSQMRSRSESSPKRKSQKMRLKSRSVSPIKTGGFRRGDNNKEKAKRKKDEGQKIDSEDGERSGSSEGKGRGSVRLEDEIENDGEEEEEEEEEENKEESSIPTHARMSPEGVEDEMNGLQDLFGLEVPAGKNSPASRNRGGIAKVAGTLSSKRPPSMAKFNSSGSKNDIAKRVFHSTNSAAGEGHNKASKDVNEEEEFRADQLPSFAKSYILPKVLKTKDVRAARERHLQKLKSSSSEGQDKDDEAFKFSMLKASLDYEASKLPYIQNKDGGGLDSLRRTLEQIAKEEGGKKNQQKKRKKKKSSTGTFGGSPHKLTRGPSRLTNKKPSIILPGNRKVAPKSNFTPGGSVEPSMVRLKGPGSLKSYINYVKKDNYVPLPILEPEKAVEAELYAESPDESRNSSRNSNQNKFSKLAMQINTMTEAHKSIVAQFESIRAKAEETAKHIKPAISKTHLAKRLSTQFEQEETLETVDFDAHKKKDLKQNQSILGQKTSKKSWISSPTKKRNSNALDLLDPGMPAPATGSSNESGYSSYSHTTSVDASSTVTSTTNTAPRKSSEFDMLLDDPPRPGWEDASEEMDRGASSLFFNDDEVSREWNDASILQDALAGKNLLAMLEEPKPKFTEALTKRNPDGASTLDLFIDRAAEFGANKHPALQKIMLEIESTKHIRGT